MFSGRWRRRLPVSIRSEETPMDPCQMPRKSSLEEHRWRNCGDLGTDPWTFGSSTFMAFQTPARESPSGAKMASTERDGGGIAVGQALVSFSVDGLFPEEDVSSLVLSSDALPGAVKALAEQKAKLEVCLIWTAANGERRF